MQKTRGEPEQPTVPNDAGQATTAEEAMDAVTTVDGDVDESAYAPTPAQDEPSTLEK